jgi:hypothetical protein
MLLNFDDLIDLIGNVQIVFIHLTSSQRGVTKSSNWNEISGIVTQMMLFARLELFGQGFARAEPRVRVISGERSSGARTQAPTVMHQPAC